MQKVLILSLSALICFSLSACNGSSDHNGSGNDSAGKSSPSVEAVHMPEFRKEIKKEPVAEFKEKIIDQLNSNWYFSVKLYETAKTLSYRVEMQYEELEGDDTLQLPDLGMPPQPVIRKGTDSMGKYSCILGFMDHDSAFREYKLVYVRGSQLGIRALKHYAVTQGYRLESQDAR
jgi:predicted small secreted protein